jgi:repressor LexA
LSKHFNLPLDFNWGDDEEISDDSTFYNTTEQKSGAVRIPVLGRVAAGIPIEAITDIDDYEEISPEMAKNGQYIALRIHGRSMEPRMCENDIIIVRLQNDVESGDIAVVFVNGGDATCKKIKKLQDGIMLISTNHEYDTMYYTNKQVKDLPIKILGKVVEIRVKL